MMPSIETECSLIQAVATLSEKAILSIPDDEPERLFGPDPSQIAALFRTLAKQWHSDRNKSPGAGTTFAHISVLHRNAMERARRGEWRTPGLAKFTGIDGQNYEIRYRRRLQFELGEIYVGRSCIAYALAVEHKDLADLGEQTIATLSYANEAMRDVFEKRMPNLQKSFATADEVIHVMRKTPDQILLRDLIAHCNGRLDPRHVAWIVSDLECLASYLDLSFVGLVHPALGPDTLLISPKYHSVTITGGWWYATEKGRKLVAAPGRAVDHLPGVLLKDGAASPRIALEMIRLTACEALGHANPVAAQRDQLLPQPFRKWLLSPPSASAVDDYASWTVARDASFGAPKFVNLAVDPEDVYPPL